MARPWVYALGRKYEPSNIPADPYPVITYPKDGKRTRNATSISVG